MDDRLWTNKFDEYITGQKYIFRDKKKLSVSVASMRPPSVEVLEKLKAHPCWKKFKYADIPLGDSLAPYLCTLPTESLGLLRHADEIAETVLKTVRPDVVGYSYISTLAGKRLAWHCGKQGIPVVCYQHGGTYGTHDDSPAELCDYAYSNFFFCYGENMRARIDPVVPIRSEFIPMGSSRIARQLMKKNKPKARIPLRVLWVGEASFRNTLGSSFVFEDTQRFVVEKKLLSILNRSQQLITVYRPLPSQVDMNGTAKWVQRSILPRVKVDVKTAMEELIEKHDVIIIDSASSTTLFESLALHRPVVLYCDPAQTWMTSGYMEDLGKAVRWHKSLDSFMADIESLSMAPEKFYDRLDKKLQMEFLKRYVLGGTEKDIPGKIASSLRSIVAQFGKGSHIDQRS